MVKKESVPVSSSEELSDYGSEENEDFEDGESDIEMS
jgi:hypothetical protein